MFEAVFFDIDQFSLSTAVFFWWLRGKWKQKNGKPMG
jgi:hypothetical protein